MARYLNVAHEGDQLAVSLHNDNAPRWLLKPRIGVEPAVTLRFATANHARCERVRLTLGAVEECSLRAVAGRRNPLVWVEGSVRRGHDAAAFPLRELFNATMP